MSLPETQPALPPRKPPGSETERIPQFGSQHHVRHFALWDTRPCWICTRIGICQHRERELAFIKLETYFNGQEEGLKTNPWQSSTTPGPPPFSNFIPSPPSFHPPSAP